MFNCATISVSERDIAKANSFIYPDMNLSKGVVPDQYQLREPYRLIFTTQNIDGEDGFFSNCFVSPRGTLYSSLAVEEFAAYKKALRLHSHNFYELMFVLDGQIFVNVENERHLYKKGSCCILNTNIMHSEEYDSNYSIVFLQISPALMQSLYSDMELNYFDIEKKPVESDMYEFLQENLSVGSVSKDYVDFIPEKNVDLLERTVHGYFDQITSRTLSPCLGSSVKIKGLILDLFYYLLEPENFSTTPLQIGTDAESALFNAIFLAMKRSDGRISRSQLAEKMSYSGSYLNEICKKYSGLSLFEYGMTFTMKKAADMLATTDLNVDEIGTLLGFSNHTHFYKLFKERYDVTPAKYRRAKKLASSFG
ncbi:AraC family transcriptional regulator [Butyrivibrio sp. AC2005]|uniref:AraC family transcriptional regulator n=1 Tax=Butyrivibrio sp. AC2005 TaxID=1280672 RepID=UPI000428A0C0|nr:AraC family transcriptional regulator [Butyrivibrio sp. AC2005]